LLLLLLHRHHCHQCQALLNDAEDIVAASAKTIRRQLASQGVDLEADWAEVEGVGEAAAARTTTGRAKAAAAAAAAAAAEEQLLQLKRPKFKPQVMQ
jgi:hypothetical protein